MERKERPGVMLYFDVFRPLLNRLDNEKSGQLLRAVIDYAEHGEVHDDLDPLTGMAFDLIRPKIDHDAERYEESREQRQYAVYCREKQKAGEPCMKISEWRLSRYSQNIGPISPDNDNNGSYPSTSPTVSTSVSPEVSPSSYRPKSGETTGGVKGEGCKGEGARGGSAEDLQTAWKAAKVAGDYDAAMKIDGDLCRMGYSIDPYTGKLSKR